MSNFWTWGNYVSWDSCIEANRLCNLRTCPDTMNCCVTNCIGMPTIKGIAIALLFVSIALVAVLIINKYSNSLSGKLIKSEV